MTDITYLATAAGWVYLAVVVDLFSRKVVGWSISDSLATTELVAEALRHADRGAAADRQANCCTIRDRGCQYTSDAYQQTLRTLGIECSMSRTGCCYDNAVVERFFWSLKHEWTKHESSRISKRRGSACSSTSKPFTIPCGFIRRSATYPPTKFETDYAPVLAA